MERDDSPYSPRSQLLLDEVERELGLGMIPCLFTSFAGQPHLLAAVWLPFRDVILRGLVPRLLKEMIGTIVAETARCEYIRVVHLHSLSFQGADPVVLAHLRRKDYTAPELSAKHRAAFRFALAAADAGREDDGESPHRPSVADLRMGLVSAGFGDDESAELAATIAVFEYLCAVVRMLDLDPAHS